MSMFKRGKEWIGITNIPNRKRKALVIGEGVMFEIAAYFKNDECAEKFEEMLSNWLKAKPIKDRKRGDDI